MIRLPYIVDVHLRWSDTDAYGHVNNVTFLHLIEDARVMGLHAWLHPVETELNEGIIVARQEIEYLAPIKFRVPPVRVDMWVSRIGDRSFDLGYEISDPDEVGDETYAIAETTMALYNFDVGSIRELLAAERGILEQHVGDPVAFRRRIGTAPN